MHNNKTIQGSTEDEVWQQISADLAAEEDMFEYHVLIDQAGHEVVLDIDIDLGGGFESGFSTTSFSAAIKEHHSFKFSVHEDHFIDDIGKFFGLQDVTIGYPELDEHLIIKTNNESTVKAVFASPNVRAVFEKLNDFDFGIHLRSAVDSDVKQAFLELNIEEGITDPEALRPIYSAFLEVLLVVSGQ